METREAIVDRIAYDKDTHLEMAYWANDIFVQDLQVGGRHMKGQKFVEMVAKQSEQEQEVVNPETETATETGKVNEQLDLTFLFQGHQVETHGPGVGQVKRQDGHGGGEGSGEEPHAGGQEQQLQELAGNGVGGSLLGGGEDPGGEVSQAEKCIFCGKFKFKLQQGP